MTESIKPFYRLDQSADDRRWMRRVVSFMRRNFLLVGFGLFAVGLGTMGYLYNLYLYRVDWDWGLRINLLDDVFQPNVQLQAALAVALLIASMLFFAAAGVVQQGQVRRVSVMRLAAGTLLTAFPAAVVMWGFTLDVPGLSIDTVRLIARAAGGVLAIQGVLAVLYLVVSLLPAARAPAETEVSATLPVLRRIRAAGIGAWLLLLAASGIGLAWATDWIERPVSVPKPAEPLYATTFDAYVDEWDTYDGSDSAVITNLDGVLDEAVGGDALGMDGAVLYVVHGSPYQGEIVWSALDRKYNAFDLQVDALLGVGTPEAAQFGVIFRYRDEENFYMFRLSADGYYSLAKVKDGVEERISEWGRFDAIQQGHAANRIRVVGVRDAFRFYINDVPVPLCMRGDNLTSMWAGDECFTDRLRYTYYDSEFEQGRVALAVGTFDGSEVGVAFDNLIIVGPDTTLAPESEEGLE